MKYEETKENFILNLFDWRIKKLLALQYFRILYLIMLVIITVSVGGYEFYISRYLDISVPFKLLLGISAFIGGLVVILLTRIVYEFYFAFFYIEKHLREINSKS